VEKRPQAGATSLECDHSLFNPERAFLSGGWRATFPRSAFARHAMETNGACVRAHRRVVLRRFVAATSSISNRGNNMLRNMCVALRAAWRMSLQTATRGNRALIRKSKYTFCSCSVSRTRKARFDALVSTGLCSANTNSCSRRPGPPICVAKSKDYFQGWQLPQREVRPRLACAAN